MQLNSDLTMLINRKEYISFIRTLKIVWLSNRQSSWWRPMSLSHFIPICLNMPLFVYCYSRKDFIILKQVSVWYFLQVVCYYGKVKVCMYQVIMKYLGKLGMCKPNNLKKTRWLDINLSNISLCMHHLSDKNSSSSWELT